MKRKVRTSRPKKKTAGRRHSGTYSPGKDHLARIALGLFADRHFGSVSIRDIGKAAGVNSAMIYYHFRNKADLYRAAIDSAVDEAFELFAEHCNAERHETPAEVIRAWFDVHVRLYKQLRNVIKISLDCKGTVPGAPESRQPIKRFYRHEREILEGLIRQGVKTGHFRQDVDPATIATMVSTMLDGVLARSFFLKDFDMHETVEAFKQTIMLSLGHRRSGAGAVQQTRETLVLTERP